MGSPVSTLSYPLMAGLVYANLTARTLVYTNLRTGLTTSAPGRAARTEESSGGTAALANRRRSPKPIDPQDLSSVSERRGRCDDMLLTAATVIAQDRPLQPGWIQIDGGRVTAVGAGSPLRAGESGDLGLGDRIVVPGFVDMHGHGGGGGALPTGDADQARAEVDLHRRHGTTTSIASPGHRESRRPAADRRCDGRADR